MPKNRQSDLILFFTLFIICLSMGILKESSEQPQLGYNKNRPFIATLKERMHLTKPGSTKETYHISLNLKDSDINFRTGDSIGVFGQNDPRLVSHLIEAMHATGSESVLDPKSGQTMSLWEFLSFKANLARLTSSFLKLIYEYETLHDKKNHLNHLLQQENRPLLSQYLSTHDPLDLLKEYQKTSLPLQEICNQFGPLLPRFYSIASSLKTLPEAVDLTVALFTFTHAEEKRFGVASHFLCHLAEVNKTPIPIYVQPAHQFTLPQDPTAPIIMIGPGTGIAPFRAFMQERRSLGAKGKNWLFFGERNKASDYFYEDFWTELVHDDFLRLDLAFSRDQAEKVYVQHKMLEQAADLWKWLREGAYIFVCGDAHRMAKDVDSTLQQIACEQGNFSEIEAKAYFKELKAQKRYLLDIY